MRTVLLYLPHYQGQRYVDYPICERRTIQEFLHYAHWHIQQVLLFSLRNCPTFPIRNLQDSM